MKPLFFFSTLSRALEEFAPISPGKVKMYTCGPTVYDYAHIGNFRAYAFEDLLRRFLKYRGYNVVQVMNITDIDDKIIKSSRAEGLPFREFTKKYTAAFFEDIKSLNIEPAEYYPCANEHIPEMVAMIRGLVDRGFAYRGDDNCYYFSIAKFKDYGRLSHLKREDLKVGVRVKLDEYEKETASDFALWKAWDEDDGDVYWDVELGKGRPGWHIECSAMSMKYLGEHFDIHTGGVDNIFPHHENEIAQSEAYSNKKFVNYWLHCEHLLVDNKKMSKSLGNFYTLRDLAARGYSPIALRYFYVSTHYRSKLNFTLDGLSAAQNTINHLCDFLNRLSFLPAGSAAFAETEKLIETTRNKFEEALSEDLNSPKALASLFNLITQLNKYMDENELNSIDAEKIQKFFLEIDEKILGLDLGKRIRKAGSADIQTPALFWDLSPDDQILITERENARKSRDFKKADEIRQALSQKGIQLLDTPAGTVWKRN